MGGDSKVNKSCTNMTSHKHSESKMFTPLESFNQIFLTTVRFLKNFAEQSLLDTTLDFCEI